MRGGEVLWKGVLEQQKHMMSGLGDNDRKADLEHPAPLGHLRPLATAVPWAVRKRNSSFAFLGCTDLVFRDVHGVGAAAAKETR